MSEPKRFEFAVPDDSLDGTPREGRSSPIHGSSWESRLGCTHVFWQSTTGKLTSRLCGAAVVPYDRNGVLYYPGTCPSCSFIEREERCALRRAVDGECGCVSCKAGPR